MALLRKQFHYHAGGHMGESEDWWHLVWDDQTRDLYVEHSWDRVRIAKLDEHNAGSRRIELADFLQQRETTQAQLKLASLLKTLFAP